MVALRTRLSIKHRVSQWTGMFGLLALLTVATPKVAVSQATPPAELECDHPDARSDPLGYRQRPNRDLLREDPRSDWYCEGLLVAQHTNPLNVEVISFVKGSLGDVTQGRDTVELEAPTLPSGWSESIEVRGRGLGTNVTWLLNGRTTAGQRFGWDLTEVVREVGIEDEVGVHGLTRSTVAGPFTDDLFVPLGVSSDPLEPTTLVVRVPRAATAEWQAFLPGEATDDWVTAEMMNTDGFAKITLAAGGPPEIMILRLRWRLRGRDPDARSRVPESIRILRW